MYLQKSFKLFENNEDIIENNQKYDTLIDILNSYVFDDLDIVRQTDENFENELQYPQHKFWSFNLVGKLSTEVPVNSKIFNICVFNIPLKECTEIEGKLNSIVPIVKGYLDMDLAYTAEEYDDNYWDYIIILV